MGLCKLTSYIFFALDLCSFVTTRNSFDFYVIYNLSKISLHDRAHEYIQKSRDVPCVWYQIKINQSGKSSKFSFSPALP